MYFVVGVDLVVVVAAASDAGARSTHQCRTEQNII